MPWWLLSMKVPTKEISNVNDKAVNQKAETQHYDVLIVGAGISGIAAGRYLKTFRPNDSFAILEEKNTFGGTWDTHKYPGIRSDSDLYTFGYSFKPWIGPPIASAQEILSYLGEVIDENNLDSTIQYGQRITKANWCSSSNLWNLDVTNLNSGQTSQIKAKFLWMCQGYYRHSKGYTPNWDGMEDFEGDILHPQDWPDDFSGNGKEIVVIGSGATAATLIPNIADDCKHVTMLQRSPTFFLTAKNANELADTLREIEIDEEVIHPIVRKRIIYDQAAFTLRCRTEPDQVKKELLSMIKIHLGDDYDIDKHFTPDYRPWRQRLAFVPDADLFKSIASGKASVVTDEIERFTSKGLLLKSGEELGADTIVTATGFNLSVLGDIEFSIDNTSLAFNETVTYRGMMFTGMPNFAWVFGYFRASWTLRSEMVAEFLCKLFDHMEENSISSVVPALRESDKTMPILPWVDEEDFNPGYLQREGHLLPKRGNVNEWQHSQDYWTESKEFAEIDLNDDVFVYR